MRIEKIAVIGFGVMGREITRLCAQHGFKVVARDISDRVLGSKGLSKRASHERRSGGGAQRIGMTTDLKLCPEHTTLTSNNVAAAHNPDCGRPSVQRMPSACLSSSPSP